MSDTQLTMAQRLATFIEYTKLTPTAFARSIRVGQPSIALIVSGHRDSISVALAEKITARYTDLSTDWLLFGRGEMLKGYGDETKNMDLVSEPVVAYSPRLDALEKRLGELERAVRAMRAQK